MQQILCFAEKWRFVTHAIFHINLKKSNILTIMSRIGQFMYNDSIVGYYRVFKFEMCYIKKIKLQKTDRGYRKHVIF